MAICKHGKFGKESSILDGKYEVSESLKRSGSLFKHNVKFCAGKVVLKTCPDEIN
jgi:hypothetical protein